MSSAWISGFGGWAMVEASVLWRASWQGALFVLAVGAACRFVRRIPPAVRCWLWWLACLKLVMTLVVAAPLPLPLLPALPDSIASPASDTSVQASQAEPERDDRSTTSGAPAADTVARFQAAPRMGADPAAHSSERLPPGAPWHAILASVSEAALPWLPWLAFSGWLAGLGIGLARASRQCRAARRLLREARPLEDEQIRLQAAELAARLGLRQAPPLRESSAAPGPLVVGLLCPVIVFPPAASAQLSLVELRMALAHEMAHLRRGDLWLALVPELAQVLFWFHPGAWLAGHEWATAREAACDADALRATGAAPAAYGRFLLKLLAAGSSATPLPALGTSATFETLRRRLTMLEQFRPSRCRWSRAGLTALLALGVISALPWCVTAADVGKPSKSALEGVPELVKRVTFTEAKIPLGELVQKVADDTDVSLIAAREVADEPVAVVVKEMPARQLLDEVAGLLDYRWSKRLGLKGWRYEIWQDLASKQREGALRQATFGEVERRFRAEVARYTEMASRPPEELQRLEEASRQRLKVWESLHGEARRAYLDRPGERERGEVYSLAGRLATPVTRGMALLIGRLTPDQWAVLRRGEALTFSTDPARGELPMPADLAGGFRKVRPNMASGFSYGPGEIGEQERQREREESEKWQAATGYRVTMEIDLDRFQRKASLTLNAQAKPFRTATPPQASYFEGGEGTRLVIGAATVPVREILRPEPTVERNPGIVNDPVFGARKRFKAEPLAPANHLGVIPHFRGRFLRDLLPDIARTYGVQILADSYRTTPLAGTGLPSEPIALHELLDRLVMHTHRWQGKGNLVLLQSRTWFFDRPLEVPLRLVRRWKALSDQYGLLPLSECVAMANTLTDAQLDMESLSRVALEADMALDSYNVGRAAPALRLYAALSATQREALWRGQSIPVARMTSRQRELFVDAVRKGHPNAAGALDMSRLGSGTLTLTRWTQMRTGARHGGFAHFQYEPVKTPERGPDSPPTGKRVTTRDGVTRYGMTTLVFVLEYGAGRPVHFQANVAS
jgi:beta-lactamase regulating signal transducer with metallopeptidase domain